MENDKVNKELTNSQKVFCREYVFDWNGSRAYKIAYPGVTDDSARSCAHKLLTNAHIQKYCQELTEDDEKYVGVSKRMILTEHKKIVNMSIAHLHDSWITRKEFDQLSDDDKACISQIETQTRIDMKYEPLKDEPIPMQVDYVKIRLYDKQKSMDSLAKLLGYEAPKKIEQTSTVKSYEIVPASGKATPGK